MYPAREEKGRWRAVWYQDGQREQCEATSEDKLAARLEKVTERLAAGTPNVKRPGADLIKYYLNLDRLPLTSVGPASTRTPSGASALDRPRRGQRFRRR